jgi:hypothetical protein
MPKFTLAPVGADDFRSSAGLFPFTVELNIDAAAFWAEFNGPTPLSWCRLLRKVEWTSRPPHTAGSTRTAILALTSNHLAGTLLPLGRSRWNTSRTFSNPRERSCRVTDDLVATAIDAAGGQNLWNTLRGLTVRHVNRRPNMGDERVAAWL